MQDCLDRVQKRCDSWGFIISTNKTECVLFTSNSQLKNNLDLLKINNISLTFTSQAKFLGVIFDEKLTWKAQIEYIVKNAYRDST